MFYWFNRNDSLCNCWCARLSKSIDTYCTWFEGTRLSLLYLFMQIYVPSSRRYLDPDVQHKSLQCKILLLFNKKVKLPYPICWIVNRAKSTNLITEMTNLVTPTRFSQKLPVRGMRVIIILWLHKIISGLYFVNFTNCIEFWLNFAKQHPTIHSQYTTKYTI